MSRLISFYVLIGIIVVIGIMVYRVLATFLLPLFLAGLLVVMFRPLHERVLDWCRQRKRVAAICTTMAILFIVLAPCALVFTLAAIEGTAVVRQLDQAKIYVGVTKLRERLGLSMPHVEKWQAADQTLSNLFNQLAARPTQESSQSLVTQIQGLLSATQPVQAAERKRLLQEFGANIEALLEAFGEEPGIDEAHPGSTLLADIEEERNKPTEDVAAYREVLRGLQTEYKKFKEKMVGSSYRLSILEFFNPTDEKLHELSAQGMSLLLSQRSFKIGADFVGLVAQVVLAIVITVVATYFFFIDGPGMIETLMRLSPLDDRYEQELIEEFDRVSRAVVLATLLSAAAQGFLAGIGYWFAGLNAVFLLILLTTFMALIPFIGATSIWLPASLWLYFYEERTGAAIGLAIYGAVAVSQIDNLIKPLILHGQSNLHPLLALLSVLGGVQALGPIGILVGPMVVVFLSTLLNILHREIVSFEAEQEAEAEAEAEAAAESAGDGVAEGA